MKLVFQHQCAVILLLHYSPTPLLFHQFLRLWVQFRISNTDYETLIQ